MLCLHAIGTKHIKAQPHVTDYTVILLLMTPSGSNEAAVDTKMPAGAVLQFQHRCGFTYSFHVNLFFCAAGDELLGILDNCLASVDCDCEVSHCDTLLYLRRGARL